MQVCGLFFYVLFFVFCLCRFFESGLGKIHLAALLYLVFSFSYAAFFQKQAAQSTEAHYAIASCAVRFTIALFAALALATNAVKRQ
ncbi:hypothetical protein [Phascolarctobacterium sp.]